MNSSYKNYYQSQLSKLDSSRDLKIVVSGSEAKTNTLDLNQESARALVEFLKDRFEI